jgi:TM2 domain-containing membrane protein YozV
MWYYQQGSNRMGPVDEATIRGLLATGQISIDTLVWTTGMASWAPLQQSSLGAGLPTPPSAIPTFPTAGYANPNAKDRVAYVLLAVFLGHLGIHNFFAGYTSRAVIQLVITIVTCGFGALVTWIWAIIEAITVTKDAQGVDFK